MKKLALLIAIFAASLLPAAPVGNGSAPKVITEGLFFPCTAWGSVRVGYEGDFVFDGRMKQYEESHGRVDSFRQDTNSGTLTLNVRDRLDLFGVLGTSVIHSNWRFLDPADNVRRIKLKTHTDFLWGFGARTILYEWGNAALGFGGRYESSKLRPTSIHSDGVDVPVAGSECKWREWQVNLDISYKIDLFTPYIGAKYLNVRTDLNDFPIEIAANGSGNNHFRNRSPVGLYLGCSISSGKYVMFNIEARLVDEEAASVSADLRF